MSTSGTVKSPTLFPHHHFPMTSVPATHHPPHKKIIYQTDNGNCPQPLRMVASNGDLPIIEGNTMDQKDLYAGYAKYVRFLETMMQEGYVTENVKSQHRFFKKIVDNYQKRIDKGTK